MPSVKEIAWLAGLLEGEGCFSWSSKRVSGAGAPVIYLGMTDEDIVSRAAWLLRAPSVRRQAARVEADRPGFGGGIRKAMFRTTVSGSGAAGWMMTLWPFLGTRRRAKITEVLAAWRLRPAQKRLPPICHPHRRYEALGLCNACYNYYKAKGKITRAALAAGFTDKPHVELRECECAQ